MTKPFAPTYFAAVTDVVVIGQNFECADMTNPRGNIYGHAAFVFAEDKNGNRVCTALRTSRFEEDVLPEAERMAAALNQRLKHGKLPVAFGTWTEMRPAYGSVAYQEYGADDDLAAERDAEY